MGHVVLLGDSIFDNASYVQGGPSVVDHLRKRLPEGWKATLAAVDGAVVDDVRAQFKSIPSDATHLVLSAGGNDALGVSGLVRHGPSDSFAHVLVTLHSIQAEFQQSYRRLLDGLLALQRPLAVCTIYDAIPILEPAEYAGLCLFNDVILREAFRKKLPVVDLRLVCPHAGCYAAVSPIEPSVEGGGRIADALARLLEEEGDFAASSSRVVW